jgi:hypothetical protein
MNASSVLCAAALLCLPCLPARAQEAEAPSPAARSGEPKVQHTVIEDDSARIDELRVRGQVQRITVTPKGALKQGYEIIPGDGSREMSDGAGSTRGAAGKRVWRVFNF